MRITNKFLLPYSLFVASLLLIFLVESSSIERSTYIVHMDKGLMPKVFIDQNSWYSSIVDSIKFANPNSFKGHESSPSLTYTYDYAIHGFSASLSIFEVGAMKKSLGFISASRGRTVMLQTTYTPDFLYLGNFGLWPTSKYGEDVIIGVIDTGIWPESLSFKDHDMTANISSKWRGECQEGEKFNSSLCNLKLIGVKYFNEGLIKKKNLTRVSLNSARDEFGHGTLVSSIAAGNYVDRVSYFGYANGRARGVAPRARIAAYKVKWEEGCEDSDILAGIDSAIADGVDVINISMAVTKSTLIDDPISIGSFSAMKNGIVVTCSAGNYGPDASTLLNGYPWVITVTAGTTDRWLAGYLFLGNGVKITGRSTFPGNVSLLNAPLLHTKFLSPCDNSHSLTSLASHGIIVCDHGYNLTKQIEVVTSSLVLGAIFISSYHEDEYVSCPCTLISIQDGKALISYIESTYNPLVNMTFRGTITKTDIFAPVVANYASRGPSHVHAFAGIVKPDVMAPGSQVLGAWHPEKPAGYVGLSDCPVFSDYIVESGTSYASPHVAGLAALLKNVHPEWSPAAIRSAIITTANPFDNRRSPIRDAGNNLEFASPLAMGSGLIDPNRALDPGLIYDISPQDYVNLLCEHFSPENISTIVRSKDYNCTTPSNNLNYPSFLALYIELEERRLIKKFARTVTNVGMGGTTYKAVVTAPKNSTIIVSPEKLIFEKESEKKSFSVTITVEYRAKENMEVSYGELVWVEENRKHKVRSPIVLLFYTDK